MTNNDNTTVKTFNFPISYNTIIGVVSCQGQNSSTETSLYRYAYNVTTSGFSIRLYTDNTNCIAVSFGF